MPEGSSCRLVLALIALACAWPLVGCGGSDDGGSGEPKTAAGSGQESSAADAEAEMGTGNRSKSEAGGEGTPGGSGSPSGTAPDTAYGSGGTRQGQAAAEALGHPKKPHKSPKSQSGGGPTAALSPQEAATYETARALCANPDTLQYAPEGIRDDAEALAKFAEGFAPAGEEQVVHDGCLVGLKSIGIG